MSRTLLNDDLRELQRQAKEVDLEVTYPFDRDGAPVLCVARPDGTLIKAIGVAEARGVIAGYKLGRGRQGPRREGR